MKRALDVNLQRTAVDVVIPKEHELLLEVTEPLFGVHKQTLALLKEVHHRYVGWAQTLADLHRRATADFFHYNRHPRGPDALLVFSDLYLKIAVEAGTAAVREEAVRRWISFLEKIASESGERLEDNLPSILRAAERLREIFQGSPQRGVQASPALKRMVRSLLAALPPQRHSAVEPILRLLAWTLQTVYEGWLEEEDPLEWYNALGLGERGRDERPEDGEHPRRPETLPRALALLSHGSLHPLRERLLRWGDETDGLRSRAPEMLSFPDHGEILHSYLEVASSFDGREAQGRDAALRRIDWLSRVIARDRLAPVHESALQQIRRSCVDVLRTASRSEGKRFLGDLFATLRRGRFSFTGTILDLVSRVGEEVLTTGEADWVDTVIEEILALDFQYPDFGGYTEEWGVRVNPHHLRNIRTYLSIIGAGPLLGRRLLAALVVHLKLGGVFVADTDLFQRDVSRLLGADIDPVYYKVKHLLKLFPVYFNEIGAEGELREVTTRLDEVRGRTDPLCHFLRKQSHVESNSLLISFVEDIARFWTTGEASSLRRYVPRSLYEHLDIKAESYRELHRIFRHLAASADRFEDLFELDIPEVRRRLDQMEGADPVDLEKAELLFRVRAEIARKYAVSHRDLLERLQGFHRVDGRSQQDLVRALDEGKKAQALERLLETLEQLQSIILSKGKTRPVEDIYHKRHIAVGIPSMYGSYREERFEAMGLTFRIESLATTLLEDAVADPAVNPLTAEGLREVTRYCHIMARALRVDGCRSLGLETCISMLDQAQNDPGITNHELLNIFQLLSRNIEHLIRQRFLDPYEEVGDRLIARMMERDVLPGWGGGGREAVLRFSERFYRDLIAETFGLQPLDALVGRSVRFLAEAMGRRKTRPGWKAHRPDLDHCVVPITPDPSSLDGIFHLGNKGFMLKSLRKNGFPVPDGFVFTTDLFRGRVARDARPDEDAHAARVLRNVSRLESLSGCRFGDPARPLLLSVRGGAPISMPGMLDSFLNVGINSEVAQGVAERRGRPWAAWDAYRRFLQMWGMSHGLERDLFDDLIRQAKQRHSVPKKALLPPERMKELALQYRELVTDHGVEVIDDPLPQLLACIDLVLRSWDSENARIYRREMQIADEWGTAVVVQSMVFGNLHPRSGTGVVLTRHPRRGSEAVELYGDFIIQSQGDDVVSGLVATFPITEEQRESEAAGAELSLQRDFPAIYETLASLVGSLILDFQLNHQEVEFTFEGDRPGDLYILQARDAVMAGTTTISAFEPGPALDAAKVATGIGAGGGAMSGRVAQSLREIESLRRRHPGDPIILLRPDTVPDDVPLVLEAEGMLTALGGATSHAAVVAKRLGKTCVVGCRQLEIYGGEGRIELAGHRIRPGDFLSISGMDGSVYLGRHPVTRARIRGPARG